MTPFFCARSGRGGCGGVVWGGRRCEKTCGAMDGGAVLEEVGLRGNRVRGSLPLGRIPSGWYLRGKRFRGNCRRGGEQGEKLLSGKLPFGGWLCGNCFRGNCCRGRGLQGYSFRVHCLWGAWKLFSGWRPVGGGETIKAALAGGFGSVAAWKLFSGWRPVGGGNDQGGVCERIWERVGAWKCAGKECKEGFQRLETGGG